MIYNMTKIVLQMLFLQCEYIIDKKKKKKRTKIVQRFKKILMKVPQKGKNVSLSL